MKVLELLREKRNISQVKMANILGISPQRYHQYEKGKRTMPIDIAKKIADYFGITLEEIFFSNDLNVVLNNNDPNQKPA